MTVLNHLSGLLGNSSFLFIRQIVVIIASFFFSTFYLFSTNQDGNSTQIYSVDWNGSDFLVTGNGFVSEPFPDFSFYENNYYIFYNLSSGFRFSIGENNQSVYSGYDVWNNGARGNSEYLLLSLIHI